MTLIGPPLTQASPTAGLLKIGLETKPDQLALVTDDAQLTYRELDDASHRLASSYLALGLRPGDRVASLMPNRPALVIHYLACWRAGLVATPLNYRYMPPEIDHALGVSGATVLLHHRERDADVAASELGPQLPLGVIRFAADETTGHHYEHFLAGEKTSLPTPRLDDPAFIYFTSGSTGKPKGVTHTQRSYGAMIAANAQGMQVAAESAFLPGASFSHIAGSLFGLLTLAVGGQLIVPKGSTGPEVLPLLRQYHPTHLWMLPAALIALVRDHLAEPADFAGIQMCLSGGDKVSAQLEREFTEIAGFPIDEGYGMTEIGGATLSPPGDIRIGSIGQACPGYELSIRDEQGAEVATGKEGRLWVRSASNAIGYWENPQATAETIVDGWLDTGDMMRADADGFLWFCGRKKQIIIHDGSNICPQEVEEAVAEHPDVALAGVVGIHDLVHGENVRA
ncbi:MAG: class I adenylate-forming enzyme family protein, partial [Planctomycetota bacterium]